MIVGVTGGIGSGKSAVTAMLEELGITVVDADLASRIIVEPGKPALAAIAEHFGADFLLSNGSLDRALLRSRVFSDESARLWLEQLTHPLIGEEIQYQLHNSTSAYTVLSSPLLLETHQKELTDCIVVVDVPESLQIARTVKRDNNQAAQIERIMAAQMSRSERLKHADFIIDNSKSLARLRVEVAQLHQSLLLKNSGDRPQAKL
ncbi:MAG: dephospho-CoA kinase [Halioglobus sp.]|jgi:dephospho-CoA kinase